MASWRRAILCSFSVLFISASATTLAQSTQQYVQLAKLPSGLPACTNYAPSGYRSKGCLITIARDQAASPPTVSLPGNVTVYIEIQNVHWDEAIAFNATTVQTAPEDLAADALKSFVGPLQGIVFSTNFMGFAEELNLSGSALASKLGLGAPPPPPPSPPPPKDPIETEQGSIKDALADAISTIQDATTELTCLETYKPYDDTTDPSSCVQTGILNNPAFKSALSQAKTDVQGAATLPLPVAEIQVADADVKARVTACQALALTDKTRPGCVSNADAIASTEARYDSMLTTMQTAQATLLQALQVLFAWPGTDQTIIFEISEPRTYNSTIAITGTETATKTVTTIATVTINWQTTPFVLSTGVLLSGLQYRTYSISPIIVNGVVQTDPTTGKNLSSVTETITTPSIDFPFVFGSYTIPFFSRANWEAKCWNHCSFLISGGVGLDLTSKSADFAVGPSFGIGSLLVTPVALIGRQSVLMDGIKVGYTGFGINPPSAVPSQNAWAEKLGFALTYTVPTP